MPSSDPASVSVPKLPAEPLLRAVRIGVPSSALTRPARPLLVGDAALGQHLGQAPVHDLHLAERPDHDVGRLQVAVDHALGVGVRQRLATCKAIAQEARPVRRRVGALGQQRRQGLALDQLHGEEGPVAEAADVVDGHDAGVLQLPADLRLLEEPPRHLGPVGVLLQQHLDRQVAAQVHVAAAQHRAHAAAGDLAEELVAVAGLCLAAAWRRTSA